MLYHQLCFSMWEDAMGYARQIAKRLKTDKMPDNIPASKALSIVDPATDYVLAELLLELQRKPRLGYTLNALAYAILDVHGVTVPAYSLAAYCVSRIFAAVDPTRDRFALAMAIATMARTLVLFSKNGKRVYDVSEGLAQRLRATELRGLSGDDLQLPYPSIHITVPRSAGLKIFDDTDQVERPCAGVYVYETSMDNVRTWRLFAVSEPEPAEKGYNDIFYFFSVELGAEGTLDQILRVTESGLKEARQDKTDWRSIWEYTVNAIVYATWPDAEREHVVMNKVAEQLWARVKRTDNRKKREALKERLRGMDKDERVQLGKSIVINRAVLPPDDVTNGGTHLAMLVRVKVSGHWKKQVYGAGRLERKLIWIQPYWRGDELAPESVKEHHLV